MYALWAFGLPLEQMWGRNKFLFFYFSAGLGAALIHTGVNYYEFQQGFNALIGAGVDGDQILSLLREGKYDTRWPELVSSPSEVKEMLSAYWQPAVGASGAIYGILVAFAMMFPNVELFLLFIPVPIKAKYFIPVLVGLDLFSGLTGYSIFGGGIAHFAHVGGALFGFIMMWYWKRNSLITIDGIKMSLGKDLRYRFTTWTAVEKIISITAVVFVLENLLLFLFQLPEDFFNQWFGPSQIIK